MSWDKRRATRIRFEHERPVTLLGVDGTWQRQCVLLDVSDTGARVRIEGSTDVLKAKEFFLLLSSTGLAFRRCELIRIEGAEVGLHFVIKKQARSASAK